MSKGNADGTSQFSSAQVEWEGAPRLDIRYEVVHKPTPAMFEAMTKVTPGLAGGGQDPVVKEIEALGAELTGHEEALFLPTTTNATVLSHMHADLTGKQLILEARSHVWWVEALHVSAMAGAATRPLMGDKFGAMALDDIEAIINETQYGYRVPVGMISLENTHNVAGGTVLTQEYTEKVAEMAHSHGAKLFLDGARVTNAAVAQDIPLKALTEPCDYVAMSLNKGLGAPYGSLLGTSSENMVGIRLLAKRLGMTAVHKSGLFAAAGIIALTQMYEGLADDQRRAHHIATELNKMDGLDVDMETVQTNLFRVNTDALGMTSLELGNRLKEHGLGIHMLAPYAFKIALCFNITDEMVEESLDIFRTVLAEVNDS